MFSEKLDFLMNIIGISGGALAHATSLDPSYISRLRNGKRELPKGQHFMNTLAHYFAENIKTDYQKKLLCEAMGYSAKWPDDKEKAEKQILSWMLIENSVERELIQNVLERLAIFFSTDLPIPVEEDFICPDSINDNREIYYGIEGKKEAFLRFLLLAVNANTPVEMHLYGDQDMPWLSDDPDFSKKTLSLITACAKQGKKIKVIHSLRADIEEMLYTVRRWIPIYLTGYVEPYYYPQIRNELYYRTTFVLPGIAAMVSSSIDRNPNGGMTLFLTEPMAVDVEESEFEHLFSLCKPLAKVYSAINNEGFWAMLKEFTFAEADTIMLHDGICPYSMIRSLWKIRDKTGDFSFELSDLENMLKHHKFTEIVAKLDPEKICIGKVPVHFSEIIGPATKYLTKEECIETLVYVINLLGKRENYNLIIRYHTFPNIFICARENTGILLYTAEKNAMAFYINQPNVVDATWKYLQSINDDYGKANKQKVINELEELIKSLM